MNTYDTPSDLPTIHRWAGTRSSRRNLLRGATGIAAAAALSRVVPVSGFAHAPQLSGKITVGFDGSNPTVVKVIQAAAASVKASAPGAEIELQPAPAGNFQTQIFLALSAGRAPDVFVLTGLGIGELGAAGFLAPLDPFLQTWDGWAQYPKVVRDGIAFQGKTFAIPYVLDTHFLYYRKDLLARAGLPREWQPRVPDDILAAAKAIKRAVPEAMPYGLYAGATGGNGTAVRGFMPLVTAFGGTLTDAQGRWIIDSPAIRAALAYYQAAYQTDKTVPLQAMTDANPAKMLKSALGTGELGLLYEGSWSYGDWETANATTAHEQIGFVNFPMALGDKTFAIGGIGNSWYMNAKAQNKALAWALIAAANTPAAQVTLNTASPHIPPRRDAAADPAFQRTPFLQAMVASIDRLRVMPPDPSYRRLITVIQNATGIVATGEATPEEAIKRYAEEMTNILGKDRVVSQP